MSEETIIEGEAVEVPVEAKNPDSKTVDHKAAAIVLKDAVESLGKAVASALQDRANVVMVRVNDEALRHMDMLVEAEVTKSRSESAALLITEGIKANQTLFNQISSITEQIITLRGRLRDMIKAGDNPSQPA